MKQDILQNIKDIAKKDFTSVESSLKNKKITASINNIHFSVIKNIVTASCDFTSEDSKETVVASISYQPSSDGIYADSEIDEISDAILSAVDDSLSTITAAEGDEDEAFVFDDDLMEDATEEVVEEDSEKLESEDSEEYEDPEEDPNIDIDNNISGHYIAECDRCRGIFISALMESDQHVEFISGVCPLCEKESDQYIKWVIKPVENSETK